MAELFLDPKEFQEQIDTFSQGIAGIKGIKYELDKKNLKLQCIDRYEECIKEFNKTVELFGQMLDLDAESMQRIKAKWMNVDSDIATKTFVEVLTGED
jgi:type VII secretion effector (TIGR04197 family)